MPRILAIDYGIKRTGIAVTDELQIIASGLTTTPSFNNCNSSGFKEDMIAINGYDERMKYGGPDREFGERLENNGIKGKQIRHKAIVLHLDHPRGYKTPESLAANLAIRKEVKDKKIVWTPFGIVKDKK
jgi:hypothetical protein